MNIYDFTGLCTTTDCDIAIKTVSKKITTLQKKKDFLEHRLEVHQEMVAKTTEDLGCRRLELSFLTKRLSWVEEGLPARECRYQISKVDCRIQFLELRLERYSKPKHLGMQFDLNELTTTLENAQQFKAGLEARRAELLQAEAPLPPATPVEAEPVAMVPLIPGQQLAAEPEPAAHPQPVAQLSQKQKGRRFVKGRQAMKRAG